MQEDFDGSFKEFFLLEFTKCLVEEFINITDVVKVSDSIVLAERKKGPLTKAEVKKEVKSAMSNLSREKRERNLKVSSLKKSRLGKIGSGVGKVVKKITRKKSFSLKAPSRRVDASPSVSGGLVINEPEFSHRLKYIKPRPTSQYIDLGKLNSLISPPVVRQIDCNGADTEIIVREGRVKNTRMTLSENEINLIINSFSVASRIPVDEGVFRAAAGKVEIVAMISESVGSKFIIRKIVPPVGGRARRRR